METKSQQQKGRDGTLFNSLDSAVDALDLARDATSVKQARDAFPFTNVLLATIRVGSVLVLVGRFKAC